MLATIGLGTRRPISASCSTEAGGLDEAGVGTSLAGSQDPVYRLIHAHDGQGVGPGDDEEIAVAAGFHGGTDLLHVFLAFDDPLALHVPALLRPKLVFQKAAGGTRGDQFLHRAIDVQRIAVAGVGVHDDRNADAHADPPGPVGDLGLREQAHVGLADGRGGDGIAGDEGHGKADLLGQLGR